MRVPMAQVTAPTDPNMAPDSRPVQAAAASSSAGSQRPAADVPDDPILTKRSFLGLPVEIDLAELLAEYQGIPEDAWGVSHWDVHCSIDVLLLRGGRQGTPDDFITPDVANSPILESLPYLSRLLAGDGPFGAVTYAFIFRTKPNGITRIHWDDDAAWCNTFRVHIPIVTNPGAVLMSDGKAKHFAAGQVWTFDNQQLHSVVNGGSSRVHLIIDVVPNPKLRSLLERASFDPGQADPERWALTGGRQRGGGLPPLIDVTAQPLTIKEKKDLGLDPGGFASRIVKRSKKARLLRSPLCVGDVLIRVNGVNSCPVSRTALDYMRLRHDPGERVELQVLRGARLLRAVIRLRPENYFEWRPRLAGLLGRFGWRAGAR